jgi:F-type H+-transporting ATPase subunit a
MTEHEPWLTALFNEHLAGVANAILGLVNYKVEDPAHPWATWMVMEILVVAILFVLLAMLRPRLSADNPGGLQHLFESLYGFIKTTAHDSGIHHPEKFLPYFGTIFIFILVMNLIGIIPGFESPTMSPTVTLALALCTFLYYNVAGFAANGPAYLKQLLGPVIFLAPLMLIIEIISHLARPLSLTIRLYANMLAGDQVTLAFENVVPLLIPVIFMGLHVFVAFLQAYIFMLLSTVYVSGAISHDH